MISIRSFKKGDWIGLAYIKDVDVETNQYELDRTYFLYFLTDTKCIVGLNKEYSNNDNKFWFDIKEDELINTVLINRKDLIEKYDNYDIEVLKYKKKNDKHWSVYERTKKDYNWKYDIACGANASWCIFKRDMINDYLKDFEENKGIEKTTYNCLVNSFDIFMEEITPQVNSHGSFTFSNQSYGDGDIKKKEDYYDVMLNNYRALAFKYKHKVLSDIYYMILDFENLVEAAKKAHKFGKIDLVILEGKMAGDTVEQIVEDVNKLENIKTPYTVDKVSLRLTVEIPKILKKMDGELNG